MKTPTESPTFWVQVVPTVPEAGSPADGRPSAIHLMVSGDLDQATSRSLESAVMGALDTGTRKVVMDLSGVMFVDSAGLRAIIAASNAAESRGVRLLVTGLSGGVERLLQLTGLLERLRRDQPDAHASQN